MKDVMKRATAWFAALKRIVANYDSEMGALRTTVADSVQCIRERTDIGVDVSVNGRDPCYVVVVGKYRDRDYVRTFSVRPDDLAHLVQLLQRMQETACIRYIDAPPTVKGAIRNGLRTRGN